jgi:hypothetical protein
MGTTVPHAKKKEKKVNINVEGRSIFQPSWKVHTCTYNVLLTSLRYPEFTSYYTLYKDEQDL